jgi:hypothetical protein
MTPQEYLHPARFPGTTQPGLSLKDQMMIDALNHGDMLEHREQGQPIAPEHQATVNELEEKYAVCGQVLATAKAAAVEQLDRPPPPVSTR